jgi:hypothetical protein
MGKGENSLMQAWRTFSFSHKLISLNFLVFMHKQVRELNASGIFAHVAIIEGEGEFAQASLANFPSPFY